jgi:hypothetical protein
MLPVVSAPTGAPTGVLCTGIALPARKGAYPMPLTPPHPTPGKRSKGSTSPPSMYLPLSHTAGHCSGCFFRCSCRRRRLRSAQRATYVVSLVLVCWCGPRACLCPSCVPGEKHSVLLLQLWDWDWGVGLLHINQGPTVTNEWPIQWPFVPVIPLCAATLGAGRPPTGGSSLTSSGPRALLRPPRLIPPQTLNTFLGPLLRRHLWLVRAVALACQWSRACSTAQWGSTTMVRLGGMASRKPLNPLALRGAGHATIAPFRGRGLTLNPFELLNGVHAPFPSPGSKTALETVHIHLPEGALHGTCSNHTNASAGCDQCQVVAAAQWVCTHVRSLPSRPLHNHPNPSPTHLQVPLPTSWPSARPTPVLMASCPTPASSWPPSLPRAKTLGSQTTMWALGPTALAR